ncbi:tRNA dihydrouridine synthase [Sulfurospirillum deleyianum]|uniref:tRNA-dihydrouridine synthase n=1 Tax=Sulfurospirillum deleyianum (strain ATCC 51133 / DSM 6946 / 5175) TaxID=525898 RepID=D1AZV6_SULD5|nr:tRNA-dihydrouridine synthase [Sulfurospirillum deleyianum]ACZ11573.1 dihydrouridine synthase DuS [Sulfurospirillum deleyianum DSM 6946]
MIDTIDFEQGILALAPLAGFTDLPFRSVVKKFGADVTFSEMISANALRFKSEKTFKMLTKSPLEIPYIVQIVGSDLTSIKEAVLILNDMEGIAGIDLNCGCPVPKMVAQEAGSSLLLNLDHMQRVIETIKTYSNKRYTSAKVRLGFNTKIPELIAKACENAGADFMSMHGRTRSGAYKAEVDYQAIAEARAAVKIPVIANGDITSLEKALHVMSVTGCKNLMIGRGALGNPWIFYQLKNGLHHVEKTKILEIVLEHYDAMVEFYGEKGVSIFRKHLHTYSKGFREASEFRDKINRIEDKVLMREAIAHFFAQ